MIQFPTSIRSFALPLLLLAFACGWIALQDAPQTPLAVQPPHAPLQPLSRLPSGSSWANTAADATADLERPKAAAPVSASIIPTSAAPAAAEVVATQLTSSQAMSFPDRESPASPAHRSVLEQPQSSAPPFFQVTSLTMKARTDFGSPPAIPEIVMPESDGEESAELTGKPAEHAPAVTPTDLSGWGAVPITARRDSPIPIRSESFTPAKSPVTAELPLSHQPPSTVPLASGASSLTHNPTASNSAPAAPPSSGQLTANPATAYLFESLKPPRTTDGLEVPPTIEDFSEPPVNFDSFNPTADMQIYQGKQLYATQRPLLELGRPWYQLGQLPPPQSWLGLHNPVSQQFLVFGDFRTAAAANQLGGDSQSLLAWQSNLFFDWRVTGTERFHFNITPNTQGAANSRYLLDDDDFISEFNADINFGFFEGDLGAIVGGFTNKTLPFDLPIALGVMPLVIQNGVWLDDAFLGAAATLPARNSPLLDISNYDITFFAGWDKLNSPAFGNDDNAAKLYGVVSWWEALNGYIEADYAFVEDRDSARDRSYHNLGFAYTRRFGHLLSNSTRVIVNAGQSTQGGENTADGVLLLSENSLITANPSTILPYFNLFAGFDRPQSVGRAGIAGGILRNTGILFETDNMTGYPTLDATANQTFGMALGLSLMPQNFSQQLVLEGAMLGVMGDDLGRNAADAQRGLGFRYQLPLNNSLIFRMDGMYGFLAETEDISGLRVELRKKF